MTISPQAVISPEAQLDAGVEVGPFTSIGPGVVIGAGTRVASHVVIDGPASIGRDNRIFPFAILGQAPADLKYQGEPTRLEIGDGNILRESVNVHRGTEQGGGVTRIGDRNLLMTGVHVAHDCDIGDNVILANHVGLAGHVIIEDSVNLGGYTLVPQHLRIGRHAFSGAGALIKKDVPPFFTLDGAPAKPRGINGIGLSRKGFDEQRVRLLRRAYRALVARDMFLEEALGEVEELIRQHPDNEDLPLLLSSIRTSEKGTILSNIERGGD